MVYSSVALGSKARAHGALTGCISCLSLSELLTTAGLKLRHWGQTLYLFGLEIFKCFYHIRPLNPLSKDVNI